MTGAHRTTAHFYDRWTELFQNGFGPVFQAGTIKTGQPPHEDPEQSVVVLAERAGIEDGDRVLDAGCGVGGPAAIIAGRYPNSRIDGVTNSATQARIARERLAGLGLADRVAIHVADYQALPFPERSFDVAIFLETTGYAGDVDRMYGEAARALVPGGRLYVKDVFSRPGDLSSEERAQLDSFDELWGCVRTKTLEESVAAIIAAGLVVRRARVMNDVGTALLAGSMVELEPSGHLGFTDMGARFARKDLDPPIEFAEIVATKPARSSRIPLAR